MTPREWKNPAGELQAIRDADGMVTEYRRPPYVQLWPCPWCDCAEGAPHDLTMHIDSHLRTKVTR